MLRDGLWTTPIRVHEDNWELSGCPVNGPSIAASGDQVAVAWFTAPGDIPAVMLAFSNDAGYTFSEAIRIVRGETFGRVDTLMLDDGSALISWVEWQGADEVLLVCRATPDGCDGPHRLAVNSEGNSINFPQIAATPDGLYVAWTQPLQNGMLGSVNVHIVGFAVTSC